ncbi:hypothetical protein BS78_02G189700 [Paspalum vaginatum]|nr:hypothetical protein BS78_02G189700 [Paspalum vaginatum]
MLRSRCLDVLARGVSLPPRSRLCCLERILVKDANLLPSSCWCSTCACFAGHLWWSSPVCAYYFARVARHCCRWAFRFAGVWVVGLDRKLRGQLHLAPTTATLQRGSPCWGHCFSLHTLLFILKFNMYVLYHLSIHIF